MGQAEVEKLIPGSPDPEKALADLETKSEKKGEFPKDDPRGEEELEFTIDWTHPRTGERLTGQFKNKILTVQDRISVGNLRALLAGHTPFEALDPETRYLTEIQAHLTLSLSVKPKWFDATEMKDLRVVYKVYERAQDHENFFRGPEQAKGRSS